MAELTISPDEIRDALKDFVTSYEPNKATATEVGHVIVRATVLSEDADSARMRFEVEDTGMGIAPEAQERLFGEFEQADQSTSRRYGGTGLGLSISRRLVAIMHGTMGIESREGQGSTFWFELPLFADRSAG